MNSVGVPTRATGAGSSADTGDDAHRSGTDSAAHRYRGGARKELHQR